MRILSKLYITSALFVLLTCFNACRKPCEPEKPKDPCDNKVEVMALDSFSYCWGHVELIKSNVVYWLKIVNIDDYSGKFIPGRKYKIAYKEVDCPKDNGCGDQMSGPCFISLKCVKLICMEAVKECGTEEPKSCLGSEINPQDFGDLFSHALNGISINGDRLNAKIGYSGCGAEEIKNFRLAIQETRFRCPAPKLSRVFLAKITTRNNLICQAYFETEKCLDLSDLKAYMKQENISGPVVIRLELRDGKTQDLEYNP